MEGTFQLSFPSSNHHQTSGARVKQKRRLSQHFFSSHSLENVLTFPTKTIIGTIPNCSRILNNAKLYGGPTSKSADIRAHRIAESVGNIWCIVYSLARVVKYFQENWMIVDTVPEFSEHLQILISPPSDCAVSIEYILFYYQKLR